MRIDELDEFQGRKRNGESYSTIAARLGVGVTTVYKAIKGITWATI